MNIKEQLQQEALRLLATRAEVDERIKEIKAILKGIEVAEKSSPSHGSAGPP
jgi:hypothetical protein